MRYVKMVTSTIDGEKESISIMGDDGSTTWFDHTVGSQYTDAYLAWLEEGNVPEEWNPEGAE